MYKLQFKYIATTGRCPSAPFIDLTVGNYFGKSFPEKGKLDTGADGTVIPKNLVDKLDLKKGNEQSVTFANGVEIVTSTYFVHITIGETKFELMEVVALDKDCVLVGRDLINLWTLTLDGKNELGNIDIWSNKPNDVYR